MDFMHLLEMTGIFSLVMTIFSAIIIGKLNKDKKERDEKDLICQKANAFSAKKIDIALQGVEAVCITIKNQRANGEIDAVLKHINKVNEETDEFTREIYAKYFSGRNN